ERSACTVEVAHCSRVTEKPVPSVGAPAAALRTTPCANATCVQASTAKAHASMSAVLEARVGLNAVFAIHKPLTPGSTVRFGAAGAAPKIVGDQGRVSALQV